MPTTAGLSAAGIFGSLILAMCGAPLTLRLWISVWNASRTWPAVPEKFTTMRLPETPSTWKPWLVSQAPTFSTSLFATP